MLLRNLQHALCIKNKELVRFNVHKRGIWCVNLLAIGEKWGWGAGKTRFYIM